MVLSPLSVAVIVSLNASKRVVAGAAALACRVLDAELDLVQIVMAVALAEDRHLSRNVADDDVVAGAGTHDVVIEPEVVAVGEGMELAANRSVIDRQIDRVGVAGVPPKSWMTMPWPP